MQFTLKEISEKKKIAEEKIRKECPQYIRNNEEVSRNSIIFGHGLGSISDVLNPGLEFLVWENLEDERYWSSIDYLNILINKGVEFSETDLEKFARTTVQQAIDGKRAASSVPLFSDTWNKIGSEKSPLKNYVTSEDKKTAVNNGFWHCLNLSSESAKPSVQPDARKELGRIISYIDFFTYFDFVRGVEESQKLPDDLNLERLEESYLSWLLVQERELYRRLDKKTAENSFGKLVAPLVRELLLSEDNKEGKLKRTLANILIYEEIIETPAVQNCLGKVFEMQLRAAFGGYDENWSERTIEICARNLKDLEERTLKIWKEENESEKVNLERLYPFIEEYVPKQAYEDYIEQTKQEVQSMKRFDVELFHRWMSQKISKRVASSYHGKIRNKALEIYKMQKPRPNSETVVSLFYSSLDDKTNGFLFFDLVLRKKWDNANKLLRNYWNATFHDTPKTSKQKKEFEKGLSEYFETHGAVSINSEGLNPKACYPDYNLLKDFTERYPKVFAVK